MDGKHESSTKQELENAQVEAIIIDGRPHGDFSKPGIMQFLEKAAPDYKVLHRNTVSKRIAIK